MAAKNSIKPYLKNGYYHLYNRGVEKRDIFVDEQDYNVFLSYLKTYLMPKDLIKLNSVLYSEKSTPIQKDKASKMLKLRNYSQIIKLVSFCLMPNHFHLLVHQTEEQGIHYFLNSLATRYAGYFNRKYNRVGPLFQGVYKAVLVGSEEQLLHLSRYIHLNPITINQPDLPSSLPDFLGKRGTKWVHSEEILNYFGRTNSSISYERFIYDYLDAEFIAPLAIDFEDEEI